MPAAYSKEFLIEAALFRFDILNLNEDEKNEMRIMFANDFERHGKEKFRQYASVTPDVVKQYKTSLLKV
jgi:hypothetical protein